MNIESFIKRPFARNINTSWTLDLDSYNEGRAFMGLKFSYPPVRDVYELTGLWIFVTEKPLRKSKGVTLFEKLQVLVWCIS